MMRKARDNLELSEGDFGGDSIRRRREKCDLKE
jgi:hypothetical protein